MERADYELQELAQTSSGLPHLMSHELADDGIGCSLQEDKTKAKRDPTSQCDLGLFSGNHDDRRFLRQRPPMAFHQHLAVEAFFAAKVVFHGSQIGSGFQTDLAQAGFFKTIFREDLHGRQQETILTG
jgi:hypothetical protein